MKIETLRIDETNISSVFEFVRILHANKAIILIKNERLAKKLEREIKKLELEEITYAENKKIFLLKSIVGQYARPESFEDVSEVYYMYSLSRAYCIDNPIVEAMSNEQFIHFLETYSDRKWKILGRRIEEGNLYVKLKPKWTRKPIEGKVLDSISPVINCEYHMDDEWKNYIFNTLLRPALEQHMN